jgi:hypothetical protein
MVPDPFAHARRRHTAHRRCAPRRAAAVGPFVGYDHIELDSSREAAAVTVRSLLALVLFAALARPATAAPPTEPAKDVFARDNLVAWCIVPFDAKRRGPEERAEMVRRLGLSRVAYDWRPEHVPTFETEILAYQKHGIEFFAFWSWHESIGPLIEKHGIHPQIWRTAPSPEGKTQAERVAVAARELLPLVKRAGDLGCQFGLYNHGGWGGEPENLVGICKLLREEHDATHVGIVYNFHHGHEHVARFETAFAAMQPYLLCVNLDGMLDASKVTNEASKVVPIGSGEHERAMIEIVRKSGYTGPIGILDHRSDLDAEQSLRANLEGLERLTR